MSIKAVVFDVDGTLTDGGIYIGSQGELFKKFNVKDGYAIHSMMPKYGMVPIIITGRESQITVDRCKELKIQHLYQGVNDKVSVLKEVINQIGLDLKEVGYIGDDVNDLACMRLVGVSACPSDAVGEVKSVCDYVCTKKGGDGAVREFIEYLCK